MKNILIDVDDTLTKFLKYRNNLIKKYIKTKNLPYKILDINCTKSAKVANWPIEECINFWKDVGKNAQLKCPTQKNCAEVINKLRETGNKVFIVTARPDIYFEAYKYTKLWLDKNNICYDTLIVGKQDKKQTMIENKIDLVIDDSVSTIISAQELNIKSIIFTTKENKKFMTPVNCTRVKNWRQIENLLKD